MPTLKVYPNPYLHIDGKGRPTAFVPRAPEHQNDVGPTHRAIGATLQHRITFRAPRNSKGIYTTGQQDTQESWFEHDDEPTIVDGDPSSIAGAYYRRAIMSGELIVADEASAKLVGKSWVEPSKVLGAYKAIAQKKLRDLDHQEHTDEIHEALADHAFGPMEGVEARRAKLKDAAAEAEKKAAEEAKKTAEDAKKAAEAADFAAITPAKKLAELKAKGAPEAPVTSGSNPPKGDEKKGSKA